MKTPLTLTLIASLFLPTVAALTESQQIDVIASGQDLIINYSYPEFAKVGDTFDTTINAFSSATGLTITINAGADWTYTGCSFVEESTAGSLTGIKSARVRILMDTNTCSAMATVEATITIGGALQSQAFVGMNVFQATTEITAWPTLNAIVKNCHSQDSLPDCTTPEPDWEQLFLDWMPLLIGLLLMCVGEYRGDFIYRAFAGLFLLFAAVFSPLGALWPLPSFPRLALFCFGFYLLLLYAIQSWEIGGKIRNR